MVHESGSQLRELKLKHHGFLSVGKKQPIINQPEIGFLGFITKEFNGILHFLVQAKVEPGNVNNVQISLNTAGNQEQLLTSP